MSSSRTVPESGCCSVATVRMSVDLPAPFGPSKPNMPAGMSRDTSFSARTPFEYVLERCAMERFMTRLVGVDYATRCTRPGQMSGHAYSSSRVVVIPSEARDLQLLQCRSLASLGDDKNI